MNPSRLRWSRHVLRMRTERSPRCTLFFEEANGWRMVCGDQSIVLKKIVRTVTSGMTHLAPVRQLDCYQLD